MLAVCMILSLFFIEYFTLAGILIPGYGPFLWAPVPTAIHREPSQLVVV